VNATLFVNVQVLILAVSCFNQMVLCQSVTPTMEDSDARLQYLAKVRQP